MNDAIGDCAKLSSMNLVRHFPWAADTSRPPRVLLGVCGGIAAYKSVELARRMQDLGIVVQVVCTQNALRFVGEATWQAATGLPVRTTLWDESAEAAMGHIELARWADLILLAPITANTLAKWAHGIADDLLTTVILASTAPIWFAPAMNSQMWLAPATQANLALLRSRGARELAPAAGVQACGDVGTGRMQEPADILAALLERGALHGLRVVVNAGPTYEDIDPVRFIGNRSSGKMGFAMASAAVQMGATVTLIAGPVALPTPAGVSRIDVRSAKQMHSQVMKLTPTCDVFIACAAVADYRVETVAEQKLKKSDKALQIQLVPNPDIVSDVCNQVKRPYVLGFAAETQDLERQASEKRLRKGMDAMAANLVGTGESGFEGMTNAITLITADQKREFSTQEKPQLARKVLEALLPEILKNRKNANSRSS
jgi:phosphopantothenoylcysteine decarboxylase / phosphopantothenate---cysteine ligase